jgi:hypothetical protein
VVRVADVFSHLTNGEPTQVRESSRICASTAEGTGAAARITVAYRELRPYASKATRATAGLLQRIGAISGGSPAAGESNSANHAEICLSEARFTFFAILLHVHVSFRFTF